MFDFINFGGSTVTVDLACAYNAEIDIESDIGLTTTDTDADDDDESTWGGTFQIVMYDSSFESPIDMMTPISQSLKLCAV